MARQKNSGRVDALYAEIETLLQGKALSSDWLPGSRQEALRKAKGWKRSLHDHLCGLRDAQILSPVQFAALREQLRPLQETELSLVATFQPLVWAASITTLALLWRGLGVSGYALVAAMLAVFVATVVWARDRIGGARDAGYGEPRQRHIVPIALLSIFGSAMLIAYSNVASELAQKWSVKHFMIGRETFAADPAGFPMIRDLARKEFDVDVVLGREDESWASTSLQGPGSSAASMSLASGHCRLSFDRENVLRTFGTSTGTNTVMWIQGVMMHELGHCLDMKRDMPAFGQRSIGKRSLAPADASSAVDLPTFVEAGYQLSTQLWREALSDIIEVGFWRLKAPGQADALIADLRRKREEHRASDPVHATTCWIDHARSAASPTSVKDLLEWADNLRSNGACKLPKSA